METVFLIVCIGLGVAASAWVWWYENGPRKNTREIEQIEQKEEKQTGEK